jgi:hypothetical protein
MDGAAPRFLIRDRAEKLGAIFDRVAAGAGGRVIKTAVRAPNMNPVAERFVGSLRREVLDHVIILDDQYVRYLNEARPHQGIGQRIVKPVERLSTSDLSIESVAEALVQGGRTALILTVLSSRRSQSRFNRDGHGFADRSNQIALEP